MVPHPLWNLPECLEEHSGLVLWHLGHHGAQGEDHKAMFTRPIHKLLHLLKCKHKTDIIQEDNTEPQIMVLNIAQCVLNIAQCNRQSSITIRAFKKIGPLGH